MVRDNVTGENFHERRTFGTKITILDRGYKASGKAGDTVLSGDICDLEASFTIGTNNPFVPSFEFSPSKNSPNVGTWKLVDANGLVGSGGGEYKITGTDTEKTGIEMTGSSSGYLQAGRRTSTLKGGADIHIDLAPRDKGCGGK